MNKFEVGMRVCFKPTMESGVITSFYGTNTDVVKIKFDGKNKEDENVYDFFDLIPDTEEDRNIVFNKVKTAQKKIDEASESLNKAFSLWKEAQEELSDGRSYVSTHILREYDLDISKFESVLEEYGWSSSSLYC